MPTSRASAVWGAALQAILIEDVHHLFPRGRVSQQHRSSERARSSLARASCGGARSPASDSNSKVIVPMQLQSDVVSQLASGSGGSTFGASAQGDGGGDGTVTRATPGS
ncbi:hypothetical protein C8R45DRAFT_1219968 [Mycena sanguinolenta]|nr:hypothetical protein C8R45DRAFT_1219968 [Mycena sanguinolenta]